MARRWIAMLRSLAGGRARAEERGQNAALIAASLPGILAMVGLLVDGGRLMIEYKRAQLAMDSAAFAAAQRVDRGRFFRDQIVVLDPGEAASIGGLYGGLNSRGSARVTSIEVYGDAVVARGYMQVDTIFLKMFGAGRVTIPLTSRASPLYGITRRGQ